jgi:hypothetical protein
VRGGKKHKYRRSTPVIRLGRNFERGLYYLGLGLGKLRGWQSSADPIVERCLALSSEAVEKCQALGELVCKLESQGFVPPRKSLSYQPEVGHVVKVFGPARERLSQIYEGQISQDPHFLDELRVVKVLSTGEVVVRRGKRVPFSVRKSYLRKI